MEIPRHKNLVSYEDIRQTIKPFDLMAFRGGDLASRLINVLEKYEVGHGEFTHVGMVVTSDILPRCTVNVGETIKEIKLIPGKLYLYQSTFTYNVPYISDGMTDITTGKGFFGVQLCDLEEVIPVYIINKTAKVAYCKLSLNPWELKTDESIESLTLRRLQLQKDFTLFFENHQGRFYEMDPLSLLGAMFPPLRCIRDAQDQIFTSLIKKLNKWGLTSISSDSNLTPSGWQFCSELVANVYKLIGVLPVTLNAENILPITFFGYREFNDPIVNTPIYLKDWDYNGKEAVKY